MLRRSLVQMRLESGRKNGSRMARTVTGEIDASSLGVILPHEHLIHQISVHSGKQDNHCTNTDLIAQELIVFRKAGGGCICDVTPLGVGRNPLALREVSEKSGVPIISALGLYQMEVWPQSMREMSRQQLADFLVRQATEPADGILAGFIGEIASHNETHADFNQYALWDEECEVFKAVADVQRRTGLFVSTHASLGRHGVAQLREIIKAGGDPQRVVIGHCDAQAHEDIERDLEYYHLLLDEGAQLEFDLFGWEDLISDAQRIERIAVLVREGFSDRLLLSTDTCRLSQLQQQGGRGFVYLFTHIIPGLRQAGVPDDAIEQMTTINPARMLIPVNTKIRRHSRKFKLTQPIASH